MTFEIAAAYGVVAAVTITLRWMAARNHRSGWQRERNDVFMENLMTWAAAQAVLHTPKTRAQTVVRSVAASPGLTGQLLSLQTALNANAGMRCNPEVAEGAKAPSRELVTLGK